MKGSRSTGMHVGSKVFRHELKYYLHWSDYETISKKLRLIAYLDPHSIDETGYQIRSLYFDDIHDMALHDEKHAASSGRKYRIRIYNNSDAAIKMERKSKIGGYICKEAVAITRDEYASILTGKTDFLKETESSLLRDFYVESRQPRFVPRIVTDYIREAYVVETANVRVTFDQQLMTTVDSYDLFNDQLAMVSAIPQPMLIMEVKFDHFLPFNIQYLLQNLGNQRTLISKYAACREKTENYNYQKRAWTQNAVFFRT
ncbi:vacuolar transporter [Brevibacillus parabrevis]|uniref:polyphosphate polymerase domain-containing protein n=1 Tax=Brevibacillus parabrevis TaxID=54914 RepID=UPI0007ABADD0|nr:polyphosphate polymerase domain-containing protein [Brevibacillus parabrevis]KZE47952.1 vacuolar transporter [Brevibacillus parabrevis]